MFSPTANTPVRTAAWRRTVLDAVDLAVAFATLDSYAVPGSSRAERSMPAGAGVDRSVPPADGPLTRLDRRTAARTAAHQRPHGVLDASHGAHRLPPRPSAASRRGRRPGTVAAAQQCASPLDALRRAERHAAG